MSGEDLTSGEHYGKVGATAAPIDFNRYLYTHPFVKIF
jgi:hypothetical protein